MTSPSWPRSCPGSGQLKTRPGRPVRPGRRGQRLLGRDPVGGQAVAFQGRPPSSNDAETEEAVRGADRGIAGGGRAQPGPGGQGAERCQAGRHGACTAGRARPARYAERRCREVFLANRSFQYCPQCQTGWQGARRPAPVEVAQMSGGGRRTPLPVGATLKSFTGVCAGGGRQRGGVSWFNEGLGRWVVWAPGSDAPPLPPEYSVSAGAAHAHSAAAAPGQLSPCWYGRGGQCRPSHARRRHVEPQADDLSLSARASAHRRPCGRSGAVAGDAATDARHPGRHSRCSGAQGRVPPTSRHQAGELLADTGCLPLGGGHGQGGRRACPGLARLVPGRQCCHTGPPRRRGRGAQRVRPSVKGQVEPCGAHLRRPS